MHKHDTLRTRQSTLIFFVFKKNKIKNHSNNLGVECMAAGSGEKMYLKEQSSGHRDGGQRTQSGRQQIVLSPQISSGPLSLSLEFTTLFCCSFSDQFTSTSPSRFGYSHSNSRHLKSASLSDIIISPLSHDIRGDASGFFLRDQPCNARIHCQVPGPAQACSSCHGN